MIHRLIRVCLKIHFRHLPEGIHQRYPLRTKHALLCGIFAPNSVSVAHYSFFIGDKSPTMCDAQLTKSNFQTRPRSLRPGWMYMVLAAMMLTACGPQTNRITERVSESASVSVSQEQSEETLVNPQAWAAVPDGIDKEYTPEMLIALKDATEVLAAIKDRDYESLAEYIHPDKGAVFSPDAFVDFQEDPVFTGDQIRRFGSDDFIYNWGYDDQCEWPVRMSAHEYFDHYVYDKDYLTGSQIGINHIIRSGNCPENAAEVFPDCIFVDYHDEGTEFYEGLDWSSLKIVMEKFDDTYKVVAIIHSDYTL